MTRRLRAGTSTCMDVIDEIIQREGREYTNRPADRGGPTRYGITLQTLKEWRDQPCTAADVEALTEKEARLIYEHIYVAPFAAIANPVLREQLIDFGVNSGVVRSITTVQDVLGLPKDGRLGSMTVDTINRADARTLGNALAVARAKFLARIVHNDNAEVVNLCGWINRALSFVR